MHEHDRDLIMALAEGKLGPQAATAAEAEIAACRVCADDLALQITALETLVAAAPARLNEFESARIRRNLRRELSLETPAPAKRRRWFPVAALGGAAAVLVAAVIASGALQTLGQDEADSVASADFAATTTAAAEAAPEAPPATESETAGVAAAQAPADDMEAATTAAPSRAGDVLGFLREESSLLAAARIVIANDGDEIASRAEISQRYSADAAPVDQPDCGAAALATIENATGYFTLATGMVDDAQVLVIAYVTDPIEGTVVMAHDMVTCEIVARAP